MAYVVVKTIKGKKYLYRQESERFGKKVKTRSKYMGPLAAAPGLAIVLTLDKKRRRQFAQKLFGPPDLPKHAVKAQFEGAAVLGPTDRAELGLAPQTDHMISTKAFDRTGAIVETAAAKNEAAPAEGAAED